MERKRRWIFGDLTIILKRDFIKKSNSYYRNYNIKHTNLHALSTTPFYPSHLK